MTVITRTRKLHGKTGGTNNYGINSATTTVYIDRTEIQEDGSKRKQRFYYEIESPPDKGGGDTLSTGPGGSCNLIIEELRIK